MEFVEDEFGGYDTVADLLGRIVTLTDLGQHPLGGLWLRLSKPIYPGSDTRLSLISRQGAANV